MTQLKWIRKPKPDPKDTERLCNELNVGECLAELLVQRGIDTFEKARTFFRPQLHDLYDPFLMKDMDRAIERIEKAFANGEKIMIYGDYDVDGTTAVSVTFSYFSKHYQNIKYYIPDRYKEGYGISYMGIDFAAENGFGLIIALDCGIKSMEQVQYAKERGVDFIICDHHLPCPNMLPDAAAVLDPKRADCEYPFKELSGAGIGFKLCQAYAEKNGRPLEEVYEYLDLVAVSIASDLVKINDENRVLAYYGLKKIAENPHPGLKALLEFYKPKPEYTVSDLVFSVGPRINAAGRVAHAEAAVQLLTETDIEKAREFAAILNTRNSERKEFDQNTTDEALTMIESDGIFQTKYSTVVFNPGWHKGVIGIVASRLIERYYKPTIVLTESEGKITGSARSVNGFDIHSAIDACGHLLLHYGGHYHAAGLSLLPENLHAFQSEFERIVSSTISERSMHPCIEYDAEIDLIDITSKFGRILKQFSPFGPGNMNPVFLTRDLRVKDGNARIVGNKHLKFTVTDSDEIISFDAIAFDCGHYLQKIQSAQSFHLCYTIEENFFNNKTTLQFNVKDIGFSPLTNFYEN